MPVLGWDFLSDSFCGGCGHINLSCRWLDFGALCRFGILFGDDSRESLVIGRGVGGGLH